MSDTYLPMSQTHAGLRCCYQTPRLTLLGDVGSLTETGSMATQEDLLQNNMCDMVFGTLNMTGNMC